MEEWLTVLKALVIHPNERTQDTGDILQIARAEAKKACHTHENVNIKRILFDPVCGVYVALYEASCSREAGVSLGKRKKSDV